MVVLNLNVDCEIGTYRTYAFIFTDFGCTPYHIEVIKHNPSSFSTIQN